MNSNTKKNIQKLVLLDNRYNNYNYLKKIGDKEYKYEGINNDYLRVGYDNKDKHKITFIDPEGGPFLSIGSEVFGIEGKIAEINEVDNEYIIKFI